MGTWSALLVAPAAREFDRFVRERPRFAADIAPREKRDPVPGSRILSKDAQVITTLAWLRATGGVVESGQR